MSGGGQRVQADEPTDTAPAGPPVPGWQEVEAPQAPATPSASPLIGLAVGVAVVAFLVWRGHRTLAALLLVVVVAVTVARRLSPTFDRGAARVLHAISHGVGIALTWVFFVPFTLLVVTPVWLVLRVLRWDPLGPSPRRRGRWDPRTRRRRREFPERLYADEREEGRRLRTTAHGALAGVACCVLAVAAAFGAYEVFVTLTRDSPAPVIGADGADGADEGATALAPTLPAWQYFEVEPWSAELAQGEYQTAPQYDASLTWRNADEVHSRYLNVEEGARRSYRPTTPTGLDPVQVWFFGGSAAFGYNQRDDHTIASEVVRLAEQDGVPVEITNFGTVAYTNWQQTVLLGQLLTERPPPDLIVFYDGMNDLSLYLGADAPIRPSHMFGTQIGTLLAENDAALSFAVGTEGNTVPVGDPATAARIYNQGVELSHRIASAYGIPMATYYQPSIYTMAGPADPRVLEVTRMTQDDLEWERPRWEEARGQLDERVIDLGSSLDGVDGTLMFDWVHHNERAAAVIAAAMYETLGPQLREALDSPGV
ncbi:MAG: SGNH/GDSL hydrolase family protein [Acidimicrobiales bacterium]|nr:SGNH/GDSL hydrolase family protein [Acidimicrobiales bacterium]